MSETSLEKRNYPVNNQNQLNLFKTIKKSSLINKQGHHSYFDTENISTKSDDLSEKTSVPLPIVSFINNKDSDTVALNNMIMTTANNSNNTNAYKLSNNNNSTIVQQPQFVSNNSTNSSSASSITTAINSVNYTDDANLKLAIIEFSDLIKLIKLQGPIDHYEWLAFNTKMYFDQINVVYGAISDNCTLQTCPTMNAPGNNQFYWLDEKGKKIQIFSISIHRHCINLCS